MRLRIARKTLTFASIALVTSAAACSFLRSLDDLGNGVRTDDGGSDADAAEGGPRDDGGSDSGTDARPVCAPGVDLQTDVNNCGVCGNACLDSDPCESGACTFASVTSPTSVEELAVGGGWLVYNDGTSIWGRKTSGGAAGRIIDTGSNAIGQLVTDGVYVFWTIEQVGANVNRCSLPSCADGVKVIATGQDLPNGLALDGAGRVFWAVGGTANPKCGLPRTRPAGQVRSALLDGTDVRDMIVPGTEPNSVVDVRHVYVHATNLFWTTNDCNFDGGHPKATVWQQPLDGLTVPTPIVSPFGGYYFTSLTGDDKDLFYACEYGPLATHSQQPQSGSTRTWAGVNNSVQFARLASDDTRVYWTNDDGTLPDAGIGKKYVYGIDKLAPNQAKPTALWSRDKKRDKMPVGIAVDAKTIYFADPDENRVRALAK